jgi:N-methylhydantoinase B
VVGAVFSKALAQFAVSGSYGTSPNFIFAGTDEDGQDFQVLEILYGGIPARPVGDGLDGHSWWPLFKAVPTEYLEKYYPIEIESYRARTDSGGAGYNRGGHGVAKTYRFLSDGTISFQDDRAVTYPWGYNGGRHGMSSEKLIIHADGTEERLPSKVEVLPVSKGDRLVFSTAGAGGQGDPLTREPERTAADVHAGLVSVQAAASQYGVVVSADGEIDHAATERLREKMRSEREDPPEFDFGPVPSVEQLQAQIAEERRSFDARLAGRVTSD